MFIIQFLVLKTLFAYAYDAKPDGVWFSSRRSLIYLGASEYKTVPGIIYPVANGIACPLLLFVLVNLTVNHCVCY